MAGLTAAAYLAQSGNEVTVYEQFESVGGVTATVSSNGFKWDLGPLLLEKFEPGEEAHDILKELNIADRLKIVRDDRGIEFPDFSLWKPKEYAGPYWRKERLKELFPEDAAGLDEYYRFYDRMINLLYYSRNLSERKVRGISAKIRLWLGFQKVKKMKDWSAKQVMEHFFTNPGLRAVFTGILADFCVLPSEFAGLGVPWANIETAFDKRIPLVINGIKSIGYSYITGGVGKLVEATAEKIISHGGKIITNKAVEKILVENGKAAGVKLEDGGIDRADLILASGGAKETFYHLVGKEYLTKEYIEKIEGFHPMDSVFMVHLGVDFDPLKYQHAGLCYYYKTYDIEGAVLRCRNGFYHEGDDGFLIYVPSAHSPDMAPEGYHAITIYTIAPNVLSEGTWEEKGAYYADKLIEKAEDFLPGLSSHITERVIMAPPDFRKRTHLAHHAFGGASPVMGRPSVPHVTPVKGLYFIGAQSETGGGVAGVMIGSRKVHKIIAGNKNQ